MKFQHLIIIACFSILVLLFSFTYSKTQEGLKCPTKTTAPAPAPVLNVSASVYNMTEHHELCPNPYGLRIGCGPGCVNISQAENGNWRCTNPGGPWKTPDKCPPGYKLNSQFACVI